MTEAWDPRFFERSPIFEPLRSSAQTLRCVRWPALGDLRKMLDGRDPPIATRSGARLSFVEQGRKSPLLEDKYEARVYLRGEVQVRAASWHDLLNALVWTTFPRSKAALNERHYRALLAQHAAGSENRGPVQDAMTLFDEGGVIVAGADDELLRQLREFKWKELFWRNRPRVETAMGFYLFGHALYEKALRPFTGITGRGLLFAVAADFFQAPIAAQSAILDGMVAQRLTALKSTRELAPVPILGVPGWCAGNERESYYDNAGYFRAARCLR
jgi:DUF3025 family protein